MPLLPSRLSLLLRRPDVRLALLAWTTALAIQTGTLSGWARAWRFS